MLPITLKLLAPVFVLVGVLHLVLGVQADVLLGARIPADVITDPVLDSQNRFYGIAFTLYGWLLWAIAGEWPRHRNLLKILLYTFFAAGCARLLSLALYGMPSGPVLFLLATALILPVVGLIWIGRVPRQVLRSAAPAIAPGTSHARHCSFCGSGPTEYTHAVSGVGVSICDRCVSSCNEVIDEMRQDDVSENPDSER